MTKKFIPASALNVEQLVALGQATNQLESGGMAKYVSSLVNNGYDVSLPPRWPLIVSKPAGKTSLPVLGMQGSDISFAHIAYIVNLLGWAYINQSDRTSTTAVNALPEKPAPSCDLLDKITKWVVDYGLWPTAALRSTCPPVQHIYNDIELTVRAMLNGMLAYVPGEGGGNPYSLPPGP